MKIVFLLAQCTIPYLQDSIVTITKVLKELDIDIEVLELSKLPYFNGKKTKEMDKIVQLIKESKGVIAATNVPMLSMHGAMQSFFDSATLYGAEQFDKPILAVTYSEWLGEVEAAEKILKNWSIIGGAEGQKICLNKNAPFKDAALRLEKAAEDFYRLVKQDRPNIPSTERQLYNFVKTGQAFDYTQTGTSASHLTKESAGVKLPKEQPNSKPEVQIKSFADILKRDNKFDKPQAVGAEEEVNQPSINLSTKEQTIKEIAHLLKRQVNEEEEDEFTSIPAGIYKKPVKQSAPPPMAKRIQQIPHYFIAQHDKSLKMILKYTITNSNEEGFVAINHGDCEYHENISEAPTVELILTDEALTEILTKKITYQKAFMLGKLKVKGNFAVLPKLDQVFASV